MFELAERLGKTRAEIGQISQLELAGWKALTMVQNAEAEQARQGG